MEAFVAELVQLGGLGIIAGLLFWQNRDHQAQMAKRLETLETTLIELVRNNTTAINNAKHSDDTLARIIAMRPCLKDVDEETKKQTKQ
jgi:hypothetical protein